MATRDLAAPALFERIESLERSRATYTPAPGLGRTVGATASRYPWMSTGVTVALAENGYGPDDDFTAEIAEEEARHKHKKGFGWHSFGDAVSAAGGLASDIVKPVARTAFTALETPGHELKSLFQIAGATGYDIAAGRGVSRFGEFVEDSALGESTGLQAVQAIAQGERVDLGHGFFSGGDIRERYESESGKLRYKGQSITLGRIFADAVFEPGSKPYSLMSGLVDAGVELGADPSSLGLGKAGRLNRARKLFATEAGVVDGLRSTVVSERAAQWLSSRPGRRVVENIAAEGDVDAVWRMLGRKPSVEHLVQLADARTPDDVRSVLEPLLGVDNAFREIPTISRAAPVRRQAFKAVFRRDPLDVRAFGDVPANKLDFSRPEEALAGFDAWQLNARVPQKVRATNNTALARAMAEGSGFDRYEAVVKKGAKAVRDSLVEHGADERQARRLTKLWEDSHAETVRYLIDEHGAERSLRRVVVDGVEHELPAPFWLAQALATTMPLPDYRKIRRLTANPATRLLTAKLGKSEDFGKLRFPWAAAEKLQQEVWKPLVLLRGAWPVRVIGEEQVRIGASGLASAFRHPLSYMAWVVGEEGKAAKWMDRAGLDIGSRRLGLQRAGRGELDVLGRNIAEESEFANYADEFGAAQNRRATQWTGRDKVTLPEWTVYGHDSPDFAWWWSDNLMQVHADPVAQRIAGGLRAGDRVPVGATAPRGGLDGVKDWYFDGAGRKFRHELEKARPELAERGAADAYLDTAWSEMQRLTGGDSDLLDFVATGRFRGGDRARFGPSEEMADYMDSVMDDIAPAKVKGMKTAKTGLGEDGVVKSLNRATDWMFEVLMGRPSSFLSRGPTFRQYYWRRAEELAENATPEAGAKLVDSAVAAGLDRKAVRRISERVAKGAGELELDDVDLIAKHHGLEQTRKLLYDLHDRGQFLDAARLVFPFGPAWKEVVGTWARLTVERPQIPRRAQQLIEGARGGDYDPNTGFFHTNEFGEEVFTYPGSQWLSQATIGVPVPLEGRVGGLNIMASVIPGFGPAVSVPAAFLLPNKPEWDAIRQVILPFGEPDTGSGFAESFLPAWVQKLRQGIGKPADQRLFANTVADMQRYLLSTGDYSTGTPEEIQRLMDDATSKAKGLYVLRGIAQFGAPSAPTPRMLVHDKSGDLVFMSKLAEEWEKLQAADYRSATEKFLAKYGENAMLVMQAKTQILSYGSPVDAEGLRWARENPGLADRFPHVYGLFGPQGGEFSSEAYARSIERGDREPLTPEQAIRLANTRVANLVYHKAKDILGPRPSAQGQAGLRVLRQLLIQRYPGFGDEVVLKTNTDTLVRELESAVDDPTVRATEAGKGLALYMTARDSVRSLSESRGFSPDGFRTSLGMADAREALRGIADLISGEYPDFAALFDQALSRELADDTQQVA